MNDALRQRILRALETLPDEKGYQVLDYVEFLESKYAERARPTNFFARLTERVEDTMRAGKLPLQAITGTVGVMDSAQKVMQGLAAAGEAVLDEGLRAAGVVPGSAPSVPTSGTRPSVALPAGTQPPAAPRPAAPPAGTKPPANDPSS